jgi:cytochrome c-type biogenesis protein CcmH
MRHFDAGQYLIRKGSLRRFTTRHGRNRTLDFRVMSNAILRHLVFVAALGLTFLFASASLAEAQAGAKALESRLYAPCCYGGTLDVHESDLARDLRKEIETRLAGGESADVIQADFVERYGARVIAASSDRPIELMQLAVLAAIVIACAFVGRMVVRWRRTAVARVEPSTSTALARDEFDERLDAEVREADL